MASNASNPAASSKEKILTRIRKGLMQPTEKPFPELEGKAPEVFRTSEDPLDVQFAEQFTAVSGNFVYCESETECLQGLKTVAKAHNWKNLYTWDQRLQQLFEKADFRECRIGRNLEKADAGITRCDALVARTGSILFTSQQAGGRTLSIYPPNNIVIASTRQLVPDIKDALTLVREKYQGNIPSMINLATGPSRTADIEKTLVLGAHGPAEVYLFLIEDW